MNLSHILNQKAYSLDKKDKDNFFKNYLNFLTSYHYKKSKLYKKFLNKFNYNLKSKNDISNLPFLPVRLFKELDLMSIRKEEIFKTLYSSGTSSGKLSRIYLDKENALNQMKVLQKILINLIGNERVPMLVIEKKNIDFDRNQFNASTAAINGFSIFAKEIIYLINENDEIDYQILKEFLKKNKSKKFLIFGFTANIFNNLIEKLDIKMFDKKAFLNAILIHGGGWKKLEEKKIERKKFNEMLKKKLGIRLIRNYYGLVEQIGSIFFECECGYFVASNFSDVLIRDENFKICKPGKRGFVQLLSVLPKSYPGHSILTEDIGEIILDNKCKCNGNGTKFLIHGRLKDAELRGCSNI